jgi:sphingomyelin phosphodiesterase
MYAAIKKLVPNAAFAIFTGDIVDHAVWNTTQQQNTIDINDAYDKMKSLGIPVYGTIGNHEASPTNAFPTLKEGNSVEQWVYNIISADWTQWIGAMAANRELSFGAYSVQYPKGNLRVISINTNFYYVQNYWMYEDPMELDPSFQLAWLVTELTAAESLGERVFIIGHTPMGSSDAFHDGSNYFSQIVNRYSNTIAGLFFGHTHVDQFEVGYSNYSHRTYKNANAMAYIVPSMTPTSGMPAFRVYNVDPVTFAVLDSITYIADMTNPAFQTTGPVWTKYYSAKETYGSLLTPPITDPNAELSPSFWHNVTEVFASNSTAFMEYYARKSRGWNVGSCTGKCQTNEICQLQALRSENNCFTPTPGIHLGKRDVTSHGHGGHRDECGISVSREVLGMIAQRKELRTRLVERTERLNK